MGNDGRPACEGNVKKVQRGDLIAKVRMLSPPGSWLEDDGTLVLGALLAEGRFEIQIRRDELVPRSLIHQEFEEPVLEEDIPLEDAVCKVVYVKEASVQKDLSSPMITKLAQLERTPVLQLEMTDSDVRLNKESCGWACAMLDAHPANTLAIV